MTAVQGGGKRDGRAASGEGIWKSDPVRAEDSGTRHVVREAPRGWDAEHIPRPVTRGKPGTPCSSGCGSWRQSLTGPTPRTMQTTSSSQRRKDARERRRIMADLEWASRL